MRCEPSDRKYEMRPAPELEQDHHQRQRHKHAFQSGGWFRRVETRAEVHIQQRAASPVNPIATPDDRRLEEGVLGAAARLAQPLPHEVPKTGDGWAPGGWSRNIAARAARVPQQQPVPAGPPPDKRLVELSHPVQKMITSSDSVSRRVLYKLQQRARQQHKDSAAPDLVKRHRTAPGHPGLQEGIEFRLHSRHTLSTAARLLESPSFVAWQQGGSSQTVTEVDLYGTAVEKVLDRIVGLEDYPCVYLMPKPRMDTMHRVSAMSPLRRARSNAALVKHQPHPLWRAPTRTASYDQLPSRETVNQQSSATSAPSLRPSVPSPTLVPSSSLSQPIRSAPVLTHSGLDSFEVGAAVLVTSKEYGFGGYCIPANVTRALHRDAYSVVFPDVKVASCPHRGARCRCPCEVDDRVESALVYPNAIPEYDVEHFLAALEPGMPVQYRRKGCAGWWALTIEKIIGELSIPKTKILMRSINPNGLPLPNVYMCTIEDARRSLRPGVAFSKARKWEFASPAAHKWAVALPPEQEDVEEDEEAEMWKVHEDAGVRAAAAAKAAAAAEAAAAAAAAAAASADESPSRRR